MIDIIDFLRTDVLKVVFSDVGLKNLSLNKNAIGETVNLNSISDKENQSPMHHLLYSETVNCLTRGRHNMPLDLSDFTNFEQSVFEAIKNIKIGTICTYKDIAKTIKNPNAAQAVSNVAIKNPVLYFIPTHRIIPVRGLPLCKYGNQSLRERLLALEGHNTDDLRGNYPCTRKKC